MSSGTLFHYFPTKRDLFAGIFEADLDDNRALLEAALAGTGDPLETLLGVVETLAAPAVEPGLAALVIELVVQAQRDPDLAALVARSDDETRAGLAELVRRGQAAERFDPGLDATTTGRWLGLLIDGLFLQAAGDPSFAAPDQLGMLRLVVTRLLLAAGPATTPSPRP